METVEEPIVNVTSVVHLDQTNLVTATTATETGDCHQTNGIAELTETKSPDDTAVTIEQVNNVTEIVSVSDTNKTNDTTAESGNSISEPETKENEITTTEIKIYGEDHYSANDEGRDDSDSIVAHVIEIAESTVNLSNTNTVSDNVTFETEILVEKNDDTNEYKSAEQDKTNSILNELGQNIGLSEALCSSESIENSENNNSNNKHQVLNNEELLDILEGNDDIHISETVIAIDHPDAKSLETQLALQQLSRLKTKKRKSSTIPITTIEKPVNRNMVIKFEEDLLPSTDVVEKSIKSKRKVSSENSETYINNDTQSHKNKDNLKCPGKEIDTVDHIAKPLKEDKDMETNKAKLSASEKRSKRSDGNSKSRELKMENTKDIKKNKKKENIVNVLVQDWDDDEPMEEESRESSLEVPLDENTKEQDILQENVQNKETISKVSVDSCPSPTNQEQDHSENTCKEDKDCQSQRRQSRVIKKKVIFDPDNPDTFTKSKAINKSKEIENEHQPAKKIKVEQSVQKSSLKSPMSKLKWKKPAASKSNKQGKRLSEVDRLLMDEGAVNMIYQLTPEAPKGKKNVRTKAEFIKKIQSSTPEGKEMKFRERKKELKEEEEAKKILGGKQRMSLSSSVKSPSVCEDFETHSADDSIIYRRHSSSSYSSTGMSPRRPSEVDSNASHNAIATQKSNNQDQIEKEADSSEVFMSEINDTSTNEIIKKEDCVSLKEKLNSKLSQALKKKKRESVKNDKPPKRKKISKPEDVQKSGYRYTMKYENLTITVSNRLAEICIRKTGIKKHYNIETLKELDNALEYVDSKDDISITLVTSQCGSLCSDIDLRHLLVEESEEKKTNSANEIAEAIRSLLCRVEQHNKLLCTGVWGACSGVGLALVALSDIAIASEHATFSVGSHTMFGQTPPLPGIAVLTMQQSWSQPLVNDLVVFGRRLAASEALKAGLVSRVLWPNRFVEQVRALVNDIAAQPPQSLLLKKQLLRLKKNPEAKTTFQTIMEAERDMLAEYWTSFEGQEMLRTYYDVD